MDLLRRILPHYARETAAGGDVGAIAWTNESFERFTVDISVVRAKSVVQQD